MQLVLARWGLVMYPSPSDICSTLYIFVKIFIAVNKESAFFRVLFLRVFSIGARGIFVHSTTLSTALFLHLVFLFLNKNPMAMLPNILFNQLLNNNTFH